MTLPSSGPLSLADIQTEFGGSNPILLSEYYAGGAYVPAGTTGTYGAVPSSGTISIQNFYGTSMLVLSVTADNVSGTNFGSSFSGTVYSENSPNTTPANGTAPYTYAWTHISTSSGNTPTVVSATDQNPSWYADVDDGVPSESVWRVTVTDSVAATAQTDITVTLTWVNIS